MSAVIGKSNLPSVRSQRLHLVPAGVNHAQDKLPPGSAYRNSRTRLPGVLSGIHLERLSTLWNRRFKTGQVLYRMGAVLHAIYIVRSGFVKTMMLFNDGREQVTGFHMSGEMFGTDAIATGRYGTEAVALEDGEVWGIPYTELAILSTEVQALQIILNRTLSHEIVRQQEMMFLLGNMRAEERLVTFLVNLSDRLNARGFSPVDFNMRMTRTEIGSFLGIKLETVSRMFSKLHRGGVLDIAGKHVRITNIDRLKSLIGD